MNIGNSYYAREVHRGRAAFQKVISDYAQSDSVPTAYYKLGLSYEGLKQIDLAKKAYETAIQKFPTAFDTQLARQRLDALNRRSSRGHGHEGPNVHERGRDARGTVLAHRALRAIVPKIKFRTGYRRR